MKVTSWQTDIGVKNIQSFLVLNLVGFFRCSQFCLQNDDFLCDGLYPDCLPKHLSIGHSKPFLSLQSFPLYFQSPHPRPQLTLSPVSPVTFILLILKHQMMKNSSLLAKENVIHCSHFKGYLLSHFLPNAILVTQSFRIKHFVFVIQALGIYLLC